jgi:hypothetical protein
VLRVLDGEQPGLGRRWRHGFATVAPGEVVFRGRIPGVPLVRRAPVTIEVGDVESRTRRITLREAWSVAMGLEVIVLVTPTARVECGMPPDRATWSRERAAATG